jgi:hypothetical protein
MRFSRLRSGSRRRERGYALLLVVFLTAMLLVAAMAIGPNILTEGRREREEEMIWRGNEYVRGIKLYYRKTGKFPTALDDLTKPKTGLRFMRQAYKDPMNKEDGSWRLIYVGPMGQLIGSLKPGAQNLRFPMAGGSQLGTPASALNGPSTLPGLAQAFPQAPGQTPQSSASGGTGQQNAPGTSGPGSMPDSTSGAPTDTPTIIGGNIIGVGSKIDQKSIKWYDTAKNYRQFEFIWDPSKDTAVIGPPGIGTGGALGQNPQQPANPMPQNVNPPSQFPNPNPN